MAACAAPFPSPATRRAFQRPQCRWYLFCSWRSLVSRATQLSKSRRCCCRRRVKAQRISCCSCCCIHRWLSCSWRSCTKTSSSEGRQMVGAWPTSFWQRSTAVECARIEWQLLLLPKPQLEKLSIIYACKRMRMRIRIRMWLRMWRLWRLPWKGKSKVSRQKFCLIAGKVFVLQITYTQREPREFWFGIFEIFC